MKRLLIAAALFVLWSDAAAAIACRSAPGADQYYQYRIIAGKKCWYPGYAKLEKSVLAWKRDTPGASGTARKAPSVEAVVAKAMMTETTRDDSPRPVPFSPDFGDTFAHFPAYEVARPVVHLLFPKNVAQAWGAKRVAVVLYRRAQ